MLQGVCWHLVVNLYSNCMEQCVSATVVGILSHSAWVCYLTQCIHHAHRLREERSLASCWMCSRGSSTFSLMAGGRAYLHTKVLVILLTSLQLVWFLASKPFKYIQVYQESNKSIIIHNMMSTEVMTHLWNVCLMLSIHFSFLLLTTMKLVTQANALCPM